MLKPLFASETFASPQAAAPIAATPGAGNVFEMLFALALVLLAIFALAWLMRRLRTLPSGHSNLLRQIAALPVGDKELVVLVAVGTQRWLLGVSPGHVSLLQIIDPATLPTEPNGAGTQLGAGVAVGNFAMALRRSMGFDR